MDRSDIFPSSPWRPEIEQAVLEAHVLVFVISPESVSSEYCQAELAVATGAGKRVVPLLARETPLESVPEALAALHFLSFVGCLDADGSYGPGFEAQVDRLVEVLTTDIESLHLHTRLLNQSRLWAQRNQDKALLLRGREIEEAERWLDDQVSLGRPVQPEQQRLVRESRRSATRRQRGSAGVAVVVALAMLVLGVVALVQRSTAVHQSQVAVAGELAAESQGASSSSVIVQDLLALEAYKWSPTVQARAALVAAAEQPLESVLPSARGEVNAVAYDGSGKLLAAGYKNGIAIWDSVTDKVVGRPFDGGQQVNGIAFSPEGSTLAAAQGNGEVALFRVQTRTEEGFLPTDSSAVTGVTFSPDGRYMAAVTQNGSVYVWDLSNHRRLSTTIGAGGSLASVVFDGQGQRIAVGGGFTQSSGSETALVRVYNSALAPQWSFTESATYVNVVAFRPGGAAVAAADDDGHVLLLSSSRGRQVGKLQLGSTAEAVAFTRTGNLMATSDSQGAVQIWASSSLDEVGSAGEDGSDVFTLAFSPDGATLASGNLEGDVLLWSSTTLMPQVTTMRGRSALQLSVNSGTTLMATANRDGSVDIWDLRARTVLAHLAAEQDPLTSVAFSPRASKTLAIGEDSGQVAVYDLPNQSPLVLTGPDSSVNDVVFSANGDDLAAGYANGEVTVWDLETAKVVDELKPPASSGGITAVAFSPDGSDLAAAYANYGIEIFYLAKPRQSGTAVNVTDVVFSLGYTPSGSVLLAGDALGNVETFAADDLRPTATLPGDGSTIFGLSVAADGRTLATADDAGFLQLWDLATGQKLGPAINVGSPVLGLSFAPNRKLLVTADNSGTIVLWPSLLWSTDLHDFASDLCPRLALNLSASQWDQYVPGRPYQTICPGYRQS